MIKFKEYVRIGTAKMAPWTEDFDANFTEKGNKK